MVKKLFSISLFALRLLLAIILCMSRGTVQAASDSRHDPSPVNVSDLAPVLQFDGGECTQAVRCVYSSPHSASGSIAWGKWRDSRPASDWMNYSFNDSDPKWSNWTNVGWHNAWQNPPYDTLTIPGFGHNVVGYDSNVSYWHRYKFVIPSYTGYSISTAELDLFADDSCQAYINGEPVTGCALNIPIDVKNYKLKAGNNILAIYQNNSGGWITGLQYQLTVNYKLSDITAPSISFSTATAPTSVNTANIGGRTWLSQSEVTVTASAVDPAGVAKVFCRSDSTSDWNEVAGNTCSVPSIDTVGRHTVYALATDGFGNTTPSASPATYLFGIDNAAPEVTISTDPIPNYYPTEYTIGQPLFFKGQDPIQVTAEIGDVDSGVNSSTIKTWANAVEGTSITRTVGPDENGSGSFTVEVEDNVKNTRNITRTFYFDDSAPNMPSNVRVTNYEGVVSGHAVPYQDPVFEWEATDTRPNGSGVSGFDVAFTNDPDKKNISSYQVIPMSARHFTPGSGNVSEGINYLFIRTRDNVGNETEWTDVFHYVYDTTPPVPVTNLSETHGVQSGISQTSINSPSFSWTGPQDASDFDLYWFSKGEGQCETMTLPDIHSSTTVQDSQVSYSNWPNLLMSRAGSMCLRVYSVDEAGNRSQQFATFNFVLEGVWPDPQITGLLTNPNEHTGIFQGSDGRVKIVYGQSFTGTIQLSVSTGTSDGLITSEEMISIEFPNLSGEEPGYSIDLGNPGPSGTFTTGTYSYTYSIPPNATFSGPYQVTLTTVGDKEYYAEFDLVRDLAPEIVGITIDNSNLSESYVVDDVLYHGVPSTGALTLSAEVEDPEASHGYSQVSVTMPSGQSDTESPYSLTMSPLTLTGAEDGTYTITAADDFGNSSTGTFRVISDTAGPVVTLDLPPTSGMIVNAAWSAADPDVADGLVGSGVDHYQVRLVSPALSCDSTTVIAELDNGSTQQTSVEIADSGENTPKLCVRAYDRVGNAGAWAEEAPAIVTETSYYQFDGQVVAMAERVATTGTVQTVYFGRDHLGSVDVAVKEDGTVVSESRYQPFGQVNWISDGTSSDKGFTGQRSETGMGLMDYNARYYSPLLGRFISPDTIVPNPDNPLDWDRYSYVRNNPVNRVDPDGHRSCTDVGENGQCSSFEPVAQYDVKLTQAGLDAYLLYLRDVKDSSKWWNKDHTITPAEYLGLETLWERSDVPGIEELLIEATARQLWMEEGIAPESGSPRGNHAYCKGTKCDVGMWNFIGEFAGGHPASRFSTEPAPYPYFFPGEDEKSIIIRAGEVGNQILNPDPRYRKYSHTAPYAWGNKESVINAANVSKTYNFMSSDGKFVIYGMALVSYMTIHGIE